MTTQVRNQQLIELLKQDFVTHDAHTDLHSEDLAPHDIISSHTGTGSAFDIVGFSGTDTLAVLTPSADPGAAESLLKTTGAGLLTLSSLTSTGLITTDSLTATGGNVGTDNFSTGSTGWRIPYNGQAEFRTLLTDSAEVDGGQLQVTNGGDLNVGTLIQTNISNTSVGINKAGDDPQFQLDINGNIRWSGWGVGKMAIQLDGALMIAHYDGPEPYETDYTGTAIGHRGQPATWTGGIIFRPGKFGSKAVQIAPAVTNFLENPSFEVNVTDGWTYSQGGTGGSASRHAGKSFVGDYCAEIIASSSGWSNLQSDTVGLADGATAHLQARVYIEDSGDLEDASISIRDTTNSVTRAQVFATGESAGQWVHLKAEWTNNTGSTVNIQARLHNYVNDSVTEIWFDAIQLEVGDSYTPYADGDLDIAHPDGTTGEHAWSGTAHNSTSTRGAAYLQYVTPDHIQNGGVGSIMLWVKGEAITSTLTYLLRGTDGSSSILYVGFNNGDRIRYRVGDSNTANNSTGTIEADKWYHIVLTWDTSTIYLYINGVLDSTDSISGWSGITSSLYVGATSSMAPAYIDDLVILDRTADADEVRAVYESDAPVFAETSTFHWQAPGPAAIWVDEEGLYGRDADGNAIIGLSTVDSKSWGGNTLNAGDFLLGNSGDGYLLWDVDGGVGGGLLTIKGTVDSLDIANGDVTLDNSGITIAAGSLASNKISWDDSGEVAFIRVGIGDDMFIEANDQILVLADGNLTLGSASGFVDINGPVVMDDSLSGPTRIALDGELDFTEQASTPSNPPDGTGVHIYMKADKLIFQYNDAGTVRYKYLDLTGTGVTWVHTTTAP